MSVYSLGTDTVKAFLSLGRAHIPTAHPHSQSSLWSQNSALPMLYRIRGDVDVVFSPLGIFLQLETKEAKRLINCLLPKYINTILFASSSSFCFKDLFPV